MEFRNETGTPAAVTIGGQTATTFSYSVPARGSQKLAAAGTSATLTAGSVRIIPAGGGPAPTPLVVFSYRPAQITVSEAGVPAMSGTTFRMYVESSGAADGNLQSGIAIANHASTACTVTVELTRLDGSATGLTASLNLSAFGHAAKFLSEFFPNQSMPNTFQGILRVTTTSSGISTVGLRSRYNERGDFLIATTPPVNETEAPSSTPLYFPQIADSGGYTTQFILFKGQPGQSTAGRMQLISQTGGALNLTIQ